MDFRFEEPNVLIKVYEVWFFVFSKKIFLKKMIVWDVPHSGAIRGYEDGLVWAKTKSSR